MEEEDTVEWVPRAALLQTSDPVQHITTGFASPAQDYLERPLNLHDLVVRHPAATDFVRVKGMGMAPGILHQDILVVDRSVRARDGWVVIADIGYVRICRRLRFRSGLWRLEPDNPNYRVVPLQTLMDDSIWGVVLCVVRLLHAPQ